MNLIRIILVLILVLIIIGISYIKEKKLSLEQYSNLLNSNLYNNYKNFDMESDSNINEDNFQEEVEILGEDIYKKDNKIQIKRGNHTINVDLFSKNYELREEECNINIKNYRGNKYENIDITNYVEKDSIFDGVRDLYYQFKGKYINLSNGFFN